MSSSGTGLLENLKLVYASYGGFQSFIASGYTWVAIVITGLAWPTLVNGKWVDFALPILPTLAGFSIAAYAMYFSVLSEKARKILAAPEPALGDRSPLLILASSVSHAVFVQILGLLSAVIFTAKPFPVLVGFMSEAFIINIVFSAAGLFLTIYGIVLVLASVLSIFRILEIQTRT